MTHQYFFDFSSDLFVSEIINYARENLVAVFLGGLSVLTRISNVKNPDSEIIILETKKSVEMFIDHFSSGNSIMISSPPMKNFYCCSIKGKRALIFLIDDWIASSPTKIELILLDVRSNIAIDLDVSFSYLEKKTVEPNQHSSTDPLVFWRSVITLSHLPEFSYSNTCASPQYLCGTIPESPIYRFQEPDIEAYDYIPSFGARVVSKTLEEVIRLPHFPLHSLRAFLPYILGQGVFQGFSEAYVNSSFICFDNYVKNSKIHCVEFIPTLKLSLLLLPIYLYEKEHKDYTTSFLKKKKYPEAYQSFVNMHITYHDKCPFLFWFCFLHNCFLSNIALPSFEILFAYSSLKNTKDRFDEWAFIDGGAFWKEAVLMLYPEECDDIIKQIIESDVHDIINKKGDVSHNELAKIHGYKNMYNINIRSLKIHYYRFLKFNPDGSLDEYRSYVTNEEKIKKNR